MPTFDFQCRKCKKSFEFARAFGDVTLPKCPACGSRRTQKLLSPPTIQFKGKGFYKTDSAKPHSPKKQEPKETKSEPAAPPEKGKPTRSEQKA